MKIAIAMTFAGHGLYAIGFHPVPGHFIDMTISILGVSESQARALILGAGILDLLAAASLFVPSLFRPALVYAACWGFLTAAARPVSLYFLDGDTWNQAYWFVEALCRVPHFALPLAVMAYPAWAAGSSSPRRT